MTNAYLQADRFLIRGLCLHSRCFTKQLGMRVKVLFSRIIPDYDRHIDRRARACRGCREIAVGFPSGSSIPGFCGSYKVSGSDTESDPLLVN